MKLRHKLTIATVASSAILALSLFTYMAYKETEENKEQVQELFKMQVAQLGREFDHFTYERSLNLDSLSLRIEELIRKNQINAIENVLYEYRDTYKFYQSIFFLDEKQIKLFGTNRILIGKLSSYPFFEKIKNQKHTSFDFYRDQDIKKDVLSFAHAVYDARGNFFGVIVANVSTHYVNNFTRTISNAAQERLHKDIEIIRPDGTIVFSNFRNQKTDPDLIASLELLLSSHKNQKVHLMEDEKFYWGFSKEKFSLEKGNYQEIYFVIKALRSELSEHLYVMYKTFFVIFLVTTLVLVFVGYIIVRSITRPIEEATAAIQKIGDGEFDAINAVEVTRDEYGILVAHLKEMTQKFRVLIMKETKKSRTASIGEMVAGLAHEINNPLQLIYGHVNKLNHLLNDQNTFDRTMANKSLKIISGTVERIAKIIKGMKSLSRDASQDPFVETSIDSCLESAFLVCQEKLKENEVFVQVIKSEDNIMLECRATQIAQVIFILLSNACEAISNEKEKWIRVEIIKEKEILKIKVINSGTKIQEELAQKIFTPFFTTKPHGVGSGLGLSTSMAIVHSHKGSISVDLENEHTCILIQLPLKH